MLNKLLNGFVRRKVLFKRLGFIITIFLLVSQATIAAETINVKSVSGVYTIAVNINDSLTLDFTLDTGAADVLIPADVAYTLIRTGTIVKSDILGSGDYVLANGTVVKNTKILLRSLRIGNRVLYNVQAAVGDINSSLLLGQSALRQLEPWQLDTKSEHLVLSTPATNDDGQTLSNKLTNKNYSNAPKKIKLSDWKADQNAATVSRRSPGSTAGLGINFPMDGKSSRIVACTDEKSLFGKNSVAISLRVDGNHLVELTANLAQYNDRCWNAYLTTKMLRTIKNGSTMQVIVDQKVLYHADLYDVVIAMDRAWNYVSSRL